MEQIELDLQGNVLQGWEHLYDSLNLEVLRISKKQGHKFPLVDIVKEGELYRLAFGKGLSDYDFFNYGGHSRAVLAYQEKYLLPCRLLPHHRENPKDEPDTHYYPARPIEYIPISDIKPKRIIKLDSLSRLKRNLGFLPVKMQKEFIEKNGLVVLENGDLADIEASSTDIPF